MINTILFDLDGTLLPMDFEKFEEHYFVSMGKNVDDLLSLEDLIKLVWGSTKNMVMNTEFITNEKVFMADFAKKVGDKFEELEKRFESYYENDFDHVQNATWQSKEIQAAVALLKKKGYKLAVATNPMFPRLAIEKRIKWAGLDRKDFIHVTSFEENHYCKPQVEYYKEVLESIGKTPEECMMVGNDELEDTIAGKIGIKTYLIKDCILERGEKKIEPDMTGSYMDFLNFVESLPEIK